MHNDIQEILLTQEQIQEKVKELGAILTAEYADKNPVIVGVLKGVVIFYDTFLHPSYEQRKSFLLGY